MSELGDKRKKFTKYLAMLLVRMLEKNYQPMIGKDGLKHMPKSLHYEGLAVDIDLCDKTGKYLPNTEDHEQFGVYWESLDKDCCWGGRFKDGNHYSLMYKGKK